MNLSESNHSMYTYSCHVLELTQFNMTTTDCQSYFILHTNSYNSGNFTAIKPKYNMIVAEYSVHKLREEFQGTG